MLDRRSWVIDIFMYLGIFIFLFYVLAPFVEMFLVSVKSADDQFNVPHQFIPESFDFSNYVKIWDSVPMLPTYIFNSFFIATVATVVILILCIPTAYSFARFDFPGKNAWMLFFLTVNFFSAAVLIIPLYRLVRAAGLLNTLWAIILPQIGFVLPTAILLLRSYLMKIPKELEDAALVDGAGRFYILIRIIIPLAMPGISVVAIYAFISSWAQQFIFAITFNSKKENMPITQGLFEFFGRQWVDWNELMAAAIVGTFPVLLVFGFLQRYLVAGLTDGAVKE